jgi:hypothetical protein
LVSGPNLELTLLPNGLLGFDLLSVLLIDNIRIDLSWPSFGKLGRLPPGLFLSVMFLCFDGELPHGDLDLDSPLSEFFIVSDILSTPVVILDMKFDVPFGDLKMFLGPESLEIVDRAPWFNPRCVPGLWDPNLLLFFWNIGLLVLTGPDVYDSSLDNLRSAISFFIKIYPNFISILMQKFSSGHQKNSSKPICPRKHPKN